MLSLRSALPAGVLCGAFIFAPSPARAQGVPGRDPQGIAFGLRVGGSIPLGEANGTPLSQVASGLLPLWFDAGYRLSRYVYVGGELSYALAYIPLNFGGCNDPSISCGGHQWRFGVDTQVHFIPCFK